MTKPGISVVIPAYNAAATLERALNSVVVQNYAPLDVMVIDDGSTDDTAAVAKNYPSLPVRLIRQPRNGGESLAMNAGIEAAQFDLIAFLDADDAWRAGKLEAQIAALTPEAPFCATAFEEIDGHGNQIDGHGNQIALIGDRAFGPSGMPLWRTLLEQSVIAKPTVLARKSALLEAGLFDPRLGVAADQDMWLKLAVTGPAVYLHEVLLTVYDMPTSLMRRYKRPDLTYTIPMIERRLEALGDRLTAQERDKILGRRYGTAARNLFRHHEWALGIGVALKSWGLGDTQWKHTAGLMLSSHPLARKLKTWRDR
jgi:glycosyltransferase involved in cell wall biosynthesis